MLAHVIMNGSRYRLSYLKQLAHSVARDLKLSNIVTPATATKREFQDFGIVSFNVLASE